MAIQMDVQLADDLPESIEEPPPRSQLIAWAQAAWQGEPEAEPVLSLRIVSEAESQHLNNDYRGKNKPTNVLSFPMQMDEVFVGGDESQPDFHMLGDLAVCARVVANEAKEQHKTLEEHWAHMIVHGMLHLQGYDHLEDDEAEQMEQLEINIMQKLGFANPYRTTIPDKDVSLTESRK